MGCAESWVGTDSSGLPWNCLSHASEYNLYKWIGLLRITLHMINDNNALRWEWLAIRKRNFTCIKALGCFYNGILHCLSSNKNWTSLVFFLCIDIDQVYKYVFAITWCDETIPLELRTMYNATFTASYHFTLPRKRCVPGVIPEQRSWLHPELLIHELFIHSFHCL